MTPTEEQKVAELLHRLAEHARTEPPPATEAGVAAPAPAARRPWTTALVAAVVLAVVGAGTSVLLRARTDDRVITSSAETSRLPGGTTERLTPSGLAGRIGAASVWTGKELLVWGGSSVGPSGQPLADGAALDPSSNRWRALPPAPIPGRADAAVAWTGREMLVTLGTGANGRPLTDGAAFDPQTNRWRPLASNPVGGVFKPATVWTGTELVVVGTANTAAATTAYDPATDRWRQLTAPPGSLVMPYPQVVWTGTEAVYVLFPSISTGPVDGLVAGPAGGPVGAPPVGGPVGTAPAAGAAGSPTAGGSGAVVPTTVSAPPGPTGTPGNVASLPLPPPPDPPSPLPAMRGPNSGMFLASYSPAADRWTRLPDVALKDGTIPRLAWTGKEVLAMQRSEPGAAFDPKRQTWRPITGSPSDESGFAVHAVWTGRLVLLWSGGTNGLAYDPDANRWSTFDAGGLAIRSDPVVAWADGFLIGWGGWTSADGSAGVGENGIRYRPPRR